jgi:O-succinylbenzoate synthase
VECTSKNCKSCADFSLNFFDETEIAITSIWWSQWRSSEFVLCPGLSPFYLKPTLHDSATRFSSVIHCLHGDSGVTLSKGKISSAIGDALSNAHTFSHVLLENRSEVI